MSSVCPSEYLGVPSIGALTSADPVRRTNKFAARQEATVNIGKAFSSGCDFFGQPNALFGQLNR